MNLVFALSMIHTLGLFGLGLAVGWLAGSGRKGMALAVFLVGGFLLFLVYAWLMTGLFTIKNEIH